MDPKQQGLKERLDVALALAKQLHAKFEDWGDTLVESAINADPVQDEYDALMKRVMK